MLHWINRFLPSFKAKNDPAQVDTETPVHIKPVSIKRIKFTPLIRRQLNALRQTPLSIQRAHNKRLGVIIPYRHREAHLDECAPALHSFLTQHHIEHDILVVEQADGKPFNKGRLMNLGAQHLSKRCDYFCFHDVDFVPLAADYRHCNTPIRILSKIEGNKKQVEGIFTDSGEVGHHTFGGVIIIDKQHFSEVNGFSNDYWHWGCEDDDFFLRCLFAGLTPVADWSGHYKALVHPPSITRDALGHYQSHPQALTSLEGLTEKNKQRKSKVKRGLIDAQSEGFNNATGRLINHQETPIYSQITFEF